MGPYEVIDRPGEITYQTRHYSDHKDIRTYNIDDLTRYYPRTIVSPNVSKEDLPTTGDDHSFDDDEVEIGKAYKD